jgi:hypothetical protein
LQRAFNFVEQLQIEIVLEHGNGLLKHLLTDRLPELLVFRSFRLFEQAHPYLIELIGERFQTQLDGARRASPGLLDVFLHLLGIDDQLAGLSEIKSFSAADLQIVVAVFVDLPVQHLERNLMLFRDVARLLRELLADRADLPADLEPNAGPLRSCRASHLA